MADSMRAAAVVADRRGDPAEVVLPESEPDVERDRLSARRLELRQVAGLSAGAGMGLEPGRWEFGPARHSPGPLQAGDPDRVSFTLEIDDDRTVVIEPGTGPLRLGGRIIDGPTELGDQTIDAGSARFVVATPRPRHHRVGSSGDLPDGDVDPWVLMPTPRLNDAEPVVEALAHQRRRLHLGPEEIRHRIEAGRSRIWNRPADHPLFGTAVVAMADVVVGSNRRRHCTDRIAIPISIDLIRSPTVVTGERSHQLAVVGQLLLNVAATAHPRDLRIGLRSELPELAFVRDLPHAVERNDGWDRTSRPTLLVIDRGDGATGEEDLPVVTDGGSVLIVSHSGIAAPDGAEEIRVADESSLSIRSGGPERRRLRGTTPVGYAPAMVGRLAELLTDARARRSSVAGRQRRPI